MIFGGTPIRERERLMCSYLTESNTVLLLSRNKWPGAPLRLTSLRKTERSIREIKVEVEGRTDVLAPIRIECLTIFFTIKVKKALIKLFGWFQEGLWGVVL
jgi:hypothetical protein